VNPKSTPRANNFCQKTRPPYEQSRRSLVARRGWLLEREEYRTSRVGDTSPPSERSGNNTRAGPLTPTRCVSSKLCIWMHRCGRVKKPCGEESGCHFAIADIPGEPSVFGRSLQCQPVRGVNFREECHWSHACSLQANMRGIQWHPRV
jgi:hypothetical protein